MTSSSVDNLDERILPRRHQLKKGGTMPDRPQVILSGFADEAADPQDKSAIQQFIVFAALGFQYYTIRFINLGTATKNVMNLTDEEVAEIKRLQDQFGLKVATLGSPIGKVKLLDVDDGTKNRYVPFTEYLAKEVTRACQLAQAFETRLVRGFSFYHPRGTRAEDHLPQVVDQVGQIVDLCAKFGLIFGLEVEANLVGSNGYLLAEIHKQVGRPNLVLVFDAANLIVQGYTPKEVFEQYLAMKPGLGWMHIKDYSSPQVTEKGGHVDEDALANFVPADIGDAGHERILRDFATAIPEIEARLKPWGVPGVFLDLEPHVKGGGQFGGQSGPDGMGVALRALCRLLDYVGIEYHLRTFADLRRA